MTKTVVGVYENVGKAEQRVQELASAFDRDDVSIVVWGGEGDSGEARETQPEESRAGTGAATRAGVGAASAAPAACSPVWGSWPFPSLNRFSLPVKLRRY